MADIQYNEKGTTLHIIYQTTPGIKSMYHAFMQDMV